jgi:hypothetical protein
MFVQAGLQVHEIRGIRAANDGPGWEEWCEIAETIHVEGLDLRQTAPLQYLVRAVKPPVEITPLHIHAIGDGTSCEGPRLLWPMAMLGTIPGVRCTFSNTSHVSAFPRADIVIQQRFRSINFANQAKLLTTSEIDPEFPNKLLIAEIDDDPETLEGMSDQDFAPLRAVHAIQCSTEVVAETCRRWNPHVMVFENQIADLPPMKEPHDMPPAIFFGALNREDDWAAIMPALNRVLVDHPEVPVQVVHDRKFFDALKTEAKTFEPFLPWPQYRALLRTCDIALLPLEPTRFNRHKSDLKFLECAAEGVTALASPVVYGPTLQKQHGPKLKLVKKGLIVERSWETGLRALIETSELRHELATNAYAYVRDHRLLSQHYRKRHEWYLSLLSARPTLHAQLLDRCPELSLAHASSTTV